MTHDAPTRHRHTWDLIPWLVNGTAAEGDRREAEAHLATCSDCRDEFAFQARVQAGMSAEPVDHARPPGLDRLLARIDAGEAACVPVAASGRPREGRRTVRLLAAAVVAQGIGIGLLGALLLAHGGPDEPGYATLSSTPPLPPSATIRLVPAPSLQLAELQAMLSRNGLRIAGSNAGGSILALAPADDQAPRADRAAVLARLRASPGVLLAEPLADAGATP